MYPTLEIAVRRTSLTIIVMSSILLSGCANDKTLHFVAGAATSKYVAHHSQSPLAGCAAALTAGIAKELYDSKFGGVVDRNDAIATGVGCMYTVRF